MPRKSRRKNRKNKTRSAKRRVKTPRKEKADISFGETNCWENNQFWSPRTDPNFVQNLLGFGTSPYYDDDDPEFGNPLPMTMLFGKCDCGGEDGSSCEKCGFGMNCPLCMLGFGRNYVNAPDWFYPQTNEGLRSDANFGTKKKSKRSRRSKRKVFRKN